MKDQTKTNITRPKKTIKTRPERSIVAFKIRNQLKRVGLN